MKKTLLIFAGLGLFLFTGLAEARYLDFTEIPAWAEDAVNLVEEENIMTGFGDGTFKPAKNLNRAEAVILLFRMKGVDPQEYRNKVNRFPDVPRGAWFEKAVLAATEKGWVKGADDGKFYPAQELNRAEFATFLQRAFDLSAENKETKDYQDVQETDWFAESVKAFQANGLVRPSIVPKFFPERKVSRAEAAWVLAKILKMPRLMGTSRENNLAKFGRYVSSRKRVAIRPRHLNPNKQGYQIEKKGVYVNTFRGNDPVEVKINNGWQNLGNLVLTNKHKSKVEISNLWFKINFENGVGPARNFLLRLTDKQNKVKVYEFSRNNSLFIPDLNKFIKPNQKATFEIAIKAKNTKEFYPKAGTGQVYLSRIKGVEYADFNTKNEDSASNYTNYRQINTVYKSRNLNDIHFSPIE